MFNLNNRFFSVFIIIMFTCKSPDPAPNCIPLPVVRYFKNEDGDDQKLQELAKHAVSQESLFGVKIEYQYDHHKFFPPGWRASPFLGKGTQVDLDEAAELMPVISQFLSTYSKNTLRKNLRTIYVLKSLNFRGLEIEVVSQVI
jgi:hypothetical protein